MVDKFITQKTIKIENNEAIILFLRYNNNNEIENGEKKEKISISETSSIIVLGSRKARS